MASKRISRIDTKRRQRDERRAPFAETTPKAVKRDVGSSTTSQTPMQVRAPGLTLEDGLRDYARSRVGFKLGKFGLEITRATVSFEDLSGPKGAKLFSCRVKALLRHAGEVVVSQEGVTQREAFDAAIDAGCARGAAGHQEAGPPRQARARSLGTSPPRRRPWRVRGGTPTTRATGRERRGARHRRGPAPAPVVAAATGA